MAAVVNLQPMEPCPCGSKLAVSRCCWVNGELLKPPARITVPGPRTGYAHPKCYARAFNDCDRTISGEDYISYNILEQIGGPLTVSGLTWLQDGTTKELPLRALRANILCRRHNTALSPIDATIGQLFRRLVSPEELDTSNSDEPKMYLFSGHDLERWLLKVLFGVAEAGVADHSAGSLGIHSVRQWLDVLFENKRFPKRHGLYVHAEIGTKKTVENGVALSLISNAANGIYGLRMELRDKILILALLDPGWPIPQDSIVAHAIHRPQEFIATKSGVAKSIIRFSWLDRDSKGAIVWEHSQQDQVQS